MVSRWTLTFALLVGNSRAVVRREDSLGRDRAGEPGGVGSSSDSGARGPVFNASSATNLLCDLGFLAQPLHASVSFLT